MEKMKQRYPILDSLRGITIISMIAYHLTWDLVFLFGIKSQWYESKIGYFWQQSICYLFILLSGFCWSLSKKQSRRGFIVFGAGILVSVITILFVPEQKVLFGILTLLGSCMLLLIPLQPILLRINSWKGFLIAFFSFLFTRNINNGYLGFENWNLIKLPDFLFHGTIMTYLGFTDGTFWSTDYFSLFPWFFLFVTGYFLFRILQEKENKLPDIFTRGSSVFEYIGKYSLFIYLIHQPIIYIILMTIMKK